MKDRLLGLVHCGAEKKQMINEILDTDYTDYTVAVYKNNSVIRVIRV
ncbi:hypothetical protein [Bacteroides stercorirosoris]|uniref:Uncharacterized protein n=1 Tax=Bacteroides stercorirosoris TaxID=871324 RepID=A0A1M6JHK5_9BACE|nr:hypothetical protein [Bacteroides stercorirosoris]SHJ46105.1 hypothetical protein SAMN05444350_12939 [Bacteroides stercorirosoris]